MEIPATIDALRSEGYVIQSGIPEERSDTVRELLAEDFHGLLT